MSQGDSPVLTPAELESEMSIEVWSRVVPPVWWEAIQDFIVADGMVGDLRGHMVAGHVEGVRVVSNAYVVGQADWPGARYSDVLSHLSEGGRCGL